MTSVPPQSRVSTDNRSTGRLTGVWKWTFTPDAVASCFVQDVFDMRESGVQGADFFWLGRVPCRSVKLVGILVGVQTYEKRIVYSRAYLDDGTAVIDCQHRSSTTNQPKADKSKTTPQAPLPLEPIARVGYSVIVTGRIAPGRDKRRILIDSLVRCTSSNDEPNHWIAVRALHQNHYSLTVPFVIPLGPASQVPTNTINTAANTNPAATFVPRTPSSSSSAGSSPLKSPAKSSVTASPHKLRHPSRLHTADLTDNAFRIYLKHFMDHSNDVRQISSLPEPLTPTRSSRTIPLGDQTPRPLDRTSRRNSTLDSRQLSTPNQPQGLTLSHLRRVPELSLMAKRVVKAEAKRRARAARKQAMERGTAPPVSSEPHKLHPRMKRLFKWAILQLVKEGDVISWDGPVRPYADEGDSYIAGADTSALWKMNSSTSTAEGNSTMFSSVSIAEDDEDEGQLTDPEDGEEAFLAPSTAFLAAKVEEAITILTTQATEHAKSSANPNRPWVRVDAAGPTADEIIRCLKRDDMWRNLTKFSVEEALLMLADEGRVWTIGRGRWECCI